MPLGGLTTGAAALAGDVVEGRMTSLDSDLGPERAPSTSMAASPSLLLPSA